MLYAEANQLLLDPLKKPQSPAQVAAGLVSDGQSSPNGKYVAVASLESGRREIYVQPMPPLKGRTRVSINGGSAPRWRHDGKELYFIAADRTVMAVDTNLGATFSAGVPQELFRVPGGISGYDVHPDGKRFLIVTPSAELPDNPITVVLNWWADLKP